MFEKLVSSGLALSLALSFGVVSSEAQAGRFGGGRSIGFSRSFSSPAKPISVPSAAPKSAPAPVVPAKAGNGTVNHSAEGHGAEPAGNTAKVSTPGAKDTPSKLPVQHPTSAAVRSVDRHEIHQSGGPSFWTWYWWSQAMNSNHAHAAPVGSNVNNAVPKAEMNIESCMRAELISKFGMTSSDVARSKNSLHDLKVKFDGLPSDRLSHLSYSATSLDGKALAAYRDCTWQ